MRIAVFGAGSIGCFFGGLLSKDNEVLLVGRKPQVEAIQAMGLRITGLTEAHLQPKASTTLKGFEPELVLVTVKAYDTGTAAKALGPHIGKDTFVMSLQNGLDNLEKLMTVSGEKLLAGITSHGVTFVDLGQIKHAGTGDTVVGDVTGGARHMASEVANLFTEAGILTTISSDIRAEIWLKVAVNAAINPATAITGLKNGALLMSEELTRLMELAASEVAAVAMGRGVNLDPELAMEKAKEVATLTADNKSSMLQDIERCKRTEIESICGAIVRYGETAGVETPVNRALLALVKGIEITYMKG
jgi:2-dehydropantoate 2-reductase